MDRGCCRPIRERCASLARLALIATLVVAGAGGAMADEWKAGHARDLSFDVPAAWHFVYQPGDGTVAYAPDARRSVELPLGVFVFPARSDSLVLPDAIIARTELTLGGRPAVEYQLQLPPEAGVRTRAFDVDGVSLDGDPIGLWLIAPADAWDEWRPILDRILASTRFEPDLSAFLVPDLRGRWHVDGRQDLVASATAEDGGAYFSVDPDIDTMDDERMEIVRLGPTEVRIAAGAPAKDGTVDIAGSRIAWSDGTVWTRSPGPVAREGTGPSAARAGAALAEGEPQPGTLLFDGAVSAPWQELSSAGGDFARFARLEDGVLVVDVPDGNSWGKTGLWTREPVVAPGASDGTVETIRLRIGLDPARTSSFVVALGPRDVAEEWENHDVRFGWSRGADGAAGAAALTVRQREVWKLDTAAEAPAYVDLALDGEGVARVTLPDGRRMEAVIPDGVADGGYRLFVLAHAPVDNAAATLALRQIEMHRDVRDAVSPLLYPSPREGLVLFDGSLGRSWVRHSVGGDFGSHARLDDAGLSVVVPEGNGWAKVGLLSPAPLVWLDSFSGSAEVTVEFAIDPARSDGFGLSLAEPGWGEVGGNDPGYPNATFYWLRKPDGSGSVAEFHLYPHPQGDFWTQDGGTTAPATVRFVLRPGEIVVDADGFEPVTRAWAPIADGVGLHVYAFAHAPEPNAATRFALKTIRLTRSGEREAPVQEATEAPVPLPATLLFDGQPGALWEPIGLAGGDFAAFATFEDGTLVVEAPEGHGWAKTGLLSTGPALVLDGRINLAAARLAFQFDPDHVQNVVVALSANRVAEMWPDHVAWFSFSRNPRTGRYTLAMRHSGYADWSREIDAGWMAANWDGRLWIDAGPGWAAIRIPDGPGVRASAPIAEGRAYFATVIAHAPSQGAAAGMALQRIERSFATSPDLTDIDRLILADDDTFDVDDFANALVGE